MITREVPSGVKVASQVFEMYKFEAQVMRFARGERGDVCQVLGPLGMSLCSASCGSFNSASDSPPPPWSHLVSPRGFNTIS